MSHRRPDPRQAHRENVLRGALRMAADSVEPAADGLDRIRAKISTRQPALTDWTTSTPAGVLGSLWRWLEPVIIWLRYMAGAVVDRFRPDENRAGRLSWLRPAAALATGIFVVAAASWLITALPAVVTPTNQSGNYHNSGPGGGQPASSHSNGVQSTSGAGMGSRGPGSPQPSRSCRPGSAKPSSSPSSSRTKSPSSSPSTSPSPSSSPSPSPSSSSGTGSGTPTPSGSPSTGAPTTSPGVSAASAAASGSRTPLAPSSSGTGARSSSGQALSSPASPASSKRCG